MFDSMQPVFDIFPEPMVCLSRGTVTGVNAAARYYLPQLEAGSPVPDFLEVACTVPAGAGSFTQGPNSYTFSAAPVAGEQLVLFRPAPQRLLTQCQMDSVLRHLRELLGELIGAPRVWEEDGQAALPLSSFSQSFHRMFRLVNNLSYMQQAAEGSVEFHPLTTDLSGLCRHLVSDAYDLLHRAGVTLDYECPERSLLIPGDPELIQRMLLELISNAARAVGEGRVILGLRRTRSRAVLTVSDNGPLLDQRQMDALLQEGGAGGIPLPGQGAGLGLPIVRHIVSLHQGEMITSLSQSTPSVMVSLPTGPLESRTKVASPRRLQQDGGFSPILTALSGLLPRALFTGQELD